MRIKEIVNRIWSVRAKHLSYHAAPMFIALLLVPVFLASCKPGVPSGILSPDEMENILHDYHLAQSMADRSNDSTSERRYLYVQKVFEKYHISSADFDSSMVWYTAHASYLHDIYSNLIERFDAESKSFGGMVAGETNFTNFTAQGDTANVWNQSSFCVLQPDYQNNKLTFHMKADTTFHLSDTYMFAFDSEFIYSEGSRECYTALMIRYDNDSVASSVMNVIQNMHTELRLTTDSVHKVKEMYGYIFLNSVSSPKAFKLMLAKNIVLVRFRKPKLMNTEKSKSENQSQPLDSVGELQDSMMHVSPHQRLSPKELRELQPRERTINVVKDKPMPNLRNKGERRNLRRTR